MKKKIIEMLLNNKTYNEICQELNVAKSTVAYHAHKQGIRRGKPFEKKTYDWEHAQKIYDTGLCNRELSITLNIPSGAIRQAIKDGRLIIDRHRSCKEKIFSKLRVEEIFKENSNHDSNTARKHVLRRELLPYFCSNIRCILHNTDPLWNTEKLVLHLDHINGNNRDHRIENLRWLCPNCHSQTATYAGKNRKKNGASGENQTLD